MRAPHSPAPRSGPLDDPWGTVGSFRGDAIFPVAAPFSFGSAIFLLAAVVTPFFLWQRHFLVGQMCEIDFFAIFLHFCNML
jgi:hypothetical protein